jgi:hypothetical protein
MLDFGGIPSAGENSKALLVEGFRKSVTYSTFTTTCDEDCLLTHFRDERYFGGGGVPGQQLETCLVGKAIIQVMSKIEARELNIQCTFSLPCRSDGRIPVKLDELNISGTTLFPGAD